MLSCMNVLRNCLVKVSCSCNCEIASFQRPTLTGMMHADLNSPNSPADLLDHLYPTGDHTQVGSRFLGFTPQEHFEWPRGRNRPGDLSPTANPKPNPAMPGTSHTWHSAYMHSDRVHALWVFCLLNYHLLLHALQNPISCPCAPTLHLAHCTRRSAHMTSCNTPGEGMQLRAGAVRAPAA